MPRIGKLKHFPMVTLCITLFGCAVGPDFHSPKPPPTKRFILDVPLPKETASTKIKGGKSQQFSLGRAIPAQWWELFHCPELNDLIIKGLNNNPSVDAAQASLRQAQANLTAQIGSTMFPAVTGQAFAQRQRFSAEEFGAANAKGNIFNLYNTQVNVSYTLDIFGGARRSIEALCALVDYQRYELEATYLTLSSNIVTTAVTEASLRAQIEATNEIIKSQENILKIIQVQFELGSISRANVLQQETQLAQTRALLPSLNKSLAQTRHALAALIGSLPSENILPKFVIESLQLPAELPLSVPSLLVRQRPDVRASEALLHQASAQIGVATANMLPQFPLTGYYGWQSVNLGDLFSPHNNIWSIMAQVVQPIFQGGSLWAKRRGAIAAYDVACAQYRLTVLQAFQNVADALRAIEFDAQSLQTLVAAENAAKASLNLTQSQYKLGAVDYLALLNAQYQYQQTTINRIQAQAARFSDTAALFQALGGGWWHEVSPS